VKIFNRCSFKDDVVLHYGRNVRNYLDTIFPEKMDRKKRYDRTCLITGFDTSELLFWGLSEKSCIQN